MATTDNIRSGIIPINYIRGARQMEMDDNITISNSSNDVKNIDITMEPVTTSTTGTTNDIIDLDKIFDDTNNIKSQISESIA